MENPELIRAYADFIGNSALALFLALIPFAVAFGLYFSTRSEWEDVKLRKEFAKLKELFDSVERQTDHQFDALTSLNLEVIRLKGKIGLKDEDNNEQN